MKCAYFDCYSGVSGDMLIAACLDAGVSFRSLSSGLKKLGIRGFNVSSTRVTRHHIPATKFDVDIVGKMHHIPPDRFISIIKKSRLSLCTKDRAIRVFERLFLAEKKVHKVRSGVQLHELGSIDTLVDIAGFCICLEILGVDRVHFSNVNLGSGMTKGRHVLPVPAPATMELLKGVPVCLTKIPYELVTPTGAACLTALGSYDENVDISVEHVGYGAGNRLIEELPNALRVAIGDLKQVYTRDTVAVVETAIDDTPPLVYTYLYERLFKAGALDVYITAVYMKKNRPGQLLTVVVDPGLVSKICDIIFRETGAIGARYYISPRLKLKRKSSSVRTPYGMIETKISGTKKEDLKIMPEFESVRSAAIKSKSSFLKIYNSAKKIMFAVFLLSAALFRSASADTIYIVDGSEIKGIVVEEYSDRLVISTEDGEVSIPFDDIKSVDYDLPEQNLVAIGDRYVRSGDYQKAYFYYEKARKANPKYKDAVEGAAYLNGYIFRKESVRKEQHIQWVQDVENFRNNVSSTTENENDMMEHVIGIDLDDSSGKDIKVIKVYAGTPADKAGIMKNDRIASLWGRLVGYMSKEQVMGELLKPEGMEVKLEVDRNLKTPREGIPSSKIAVDFNGVNLKAITEDDVLYSHGFRTGDVVLAVDGHSIRYTPYKNVVDTLKKGNREVLIRRDLSIWKKKEG